MLPIAAVAGVAEHPGSIAGQVDQHCLTIAGRTGFEPTQLPRTDQIGERHRHLGSHASRKRIVDRGKVQMPVRHLRMTGEPGRGAGLRQ